MAVAIAELIRVEMARTMLKENCMLDIGGGVDRVDEVVLGW